MKLKAALWHLMRAKYMLVCDTPWLLFAGAAVSLDLPHESEALVYFFNANVFPCFLAFWKTPKIYNWICPSPKKNRNNFCLIFPEVLRTPLSSNVTNGSERKNNVVTPEGKGPGLRPQGLWGLRYPVNSMTSPLNINPTKQSFQKKKSLISATWRYT